MLRIYEYTQPGFIPNKNNAVGHLVHNCPLTELLETLFSTSLFSKLFSSTMSFLSNTFLTTSIQSLALRPKDGTLVPLSNKGRKTRVQSRHHWDCRTKSYFRCLTGEHQTFSPTNTFRTKYVLGNSMKGEINHQQMFPNQNEKNTFCPSKKCQWNQTDCILIIFPSCTW